MPSRANRLAWAPYFSKKMSRWNSNWAHDRIDVRVGANALFRFRNPAPSWVPVFKKYGSISKFQYNSSKVHLCKYSLQTSPLQNKNEYQQCITEDPTSSNHETWTRVSRRISGRIAVRVLVLADGNVHYCIVSALRKCAGWLSNTSPRRYLVLF